MDGIGSISIYLKIKLFCDNLYYTIIKNGVK